MHWRAKLDIPQKFGNINIAGGIPDRSVALYLPYKRTIWLLRRIAGHTLRIKMPKCEMQHTVCNHIRPLLWGKIHIFVQINLAICVHTGIAVLAKHIPITDINPPVKHTKKRTAAEKYPARLQALLILIRLFLLLLSHVCPPPAAANPARSPA